MSATLGVGVIGMGGFAGAHHNVVRALEIAGECRLICACDPRMDSFVDRCRELDFAARGVKLFHDYERMLDECRGELDVVTIPTPVPLHAPMHRACVERGHRRVPRKAPHTGLGRTRGDAFRGGAGGEADERRFQPHRRSAKASPETALGGRGVWRGRERQHHGALAPRGSVLRPRRLAGSFDTGWTTGARFMHR